MKLRQCKRQFAHSPAIDAAQWLPSMEAAYKDSKLIRGHCPHRATDLSTFAPDASGCVECPLHGLIWHVETGRMVPRAEWLKWRAQASSP